MMQMQGAGSLAVPQGSNKTPYPFFHIPLLLKDQVLGVLQVWLQPYVKQPAYAEFTSFLISLGAHVEQHLHSRRLGTLVLENQRLQHVLKFTGDLAGSLDPLEVSRLSVNYGRDLVGCERCSLLTLQGDRWSVLAISGQEVVEKKSSMVKAMAAFVGAHAHPTAFTRHENDPRTGAQLTRHEALILSKKELLARAEAPLEGEFTEGPANGAAHADGAATRRMERAPFHPEHAPHRRDRPRVLRAFPCGLRGDCAALRSRQATRGRLLCGKHDRRFFRHGAGREGTRLVPAPHGMDRAAHEQSARSGAGLSFTPLSLRDAADARRPPRAHGPSPPAKPDAHRDHRGHPLRGLALSEGRSDRWRLRPHAETPRDRCDRKSRAGSNRSLSAKGIM